MSKTDYPEAVACICRAALDGTPALVTALAVHGLILAHDDPAFRKRLRAFDLVAPDGQPVRLALNRFHNAELRDRVYGPELMLRLCTEAAAKDIGIFLYGSKASVVTRLRHELQRRNPHLRIVGHEPSAFRALTPGENEKLVQRVNSSGAKIVFVGLGCPLQESFAFEHRDAFTPVQVCVGAAFDFIAGTKPMAPRWMQDRSLEWLFRLSREPRRLFGRYALTNSKFVAMISMELIAETSHRLRRPWRK